VIKTSGHTGGCQYIIEEAIAVIIRKFDDSTKSRLGRGCQIFLGTTYQNWGKVYQIAIKYTNWRQIRPNDYKIYQHFPLQIPRKFTQIGIFGLKMYHPATLDSAMNVPSYDDDVSTM
jgi:hypothetical protein